MTISVVQAAQLYNAFSGSFASPVTAGNSVILMPSCYNASGATLTSNTPEYNGSTPTGSVKGKDQQSPIAGGDSVYGAIWLLPDVAGGGTSVAISVTNGQNVSSTGLIALEVAGLGSSPSFDQSASDSGNSTDPTSGSSGNITAAPELILGLGVAFAVALTPSGSPWTNFQNGGNYTAWGYQVVGSSGGSYTYATTSSSAAAWAGIIATIKGTGGGTPHTDTAALTVTPTFSAARTRGRNRTAALTVTPAFSATGSRNGSAKTAAAALTVTPAFSAAHVQAHVRTAALTVAPRYSAQAAGGAGGRVPAVALQDDDHLSLIKLRLLRGWWA
jgi:hypothetical protein